MHDKSAREIKTRNDLRSTKFADGRDYQNPNANLDYRNGCADFGTRQGSHGPRPPQPKARYTLYKNGTAVFGTTPVKEKNAVKDVCKFLLKGPSK